MSTNISSTLDRINDHRDRTARLTAGGIKLPAAYVKAGDAWQQWAGMDLTGGARAALEAGYAAGATPEDMRALGTTALLAEMATPVQLATVRNALALPALTALTSAYRPVAGKVYAQTAERLQTALDALSDAVHAVAPSLSTRDVLALSKEDQQVYLSHDVLAEQVEAALALHIDAATLAGSPITSDAQRLGLVGIIDEDSDRRAIWAAWEQAGTRGGRFTALIVAGADFDVPDVDSIRPYREPKPLETIHIHTGTGVGSVTVDPESDEYEAQLARKDRVRILGV